MEGFLFGKSRVIIIIQKTKTKPPIAQLVEQLPFKEKVLGSIPSGRTREEKPTARPYRTVRSGGLGFSDTCPSRSHVRRATHYDDTDFLTSSRHTERSQCRLNLAHRRCGRCFARLLVRLYSHTDRSFRAQKKRYAKGVFGGGRFCTLGVCGRPAQSYRKNAKRGL